MQLSNTDEIEITSQPKLALSFGDDIIRAEKNSAAFQNPTTEKMEIEPFPEKKLNDSLKQTQSLVPRTPYESDQDYEQMDKYMGMFTAGPSAKKEDAKKLKIDAVRILTWSLIFIIIEYAIYFLLQILSYLVFPGFWLGATYFLGTVITLPYLIIIGFIIQLESQLHKPFPIILKTIEFILCLILLSWSVAYLDFAFLSISYIMILNSLLLLINVAL